LAVFQTKLAALLVCNVHPEPKLQLLALRFALLAPLARQIVKIVLLENTSTQRVPAVVQIALLVLLSLAPVLLFVLHAQQVDLLM